MTFLSNLRTYAMGKANDLLNKAIDMDSPTMLRQYVRDLETAEASLRTEAAIAAGQVRTMLREKADLQHRLADETAAAKAAMSSTASNKDTLATAHASAAVTLQAQIADKEKELTDQRTLSTDLDASFVKVDARHTMMVMNVRRLESMNRSAKAKEHAAGILQSAASASASGSSISVDNIEQKIAADKDIADEKFERAMNDPGMADDPAHAADVASFLANLK